jgi:sulfonate transport system permease protein
MSDLLAPALATASARTPSRRSGFDVFWRGAAVPSALVLIWAVTAHTGLIRTNLLVPVERVIAAPFLDEAGRQLWLGLGASILRMIAGFAIGAAAGIALGLMTGMSHTADRAVGPTFNALRQIALFAWIPLLTAWFGNGDVAKVVYIALSAFFPTALNTHEGLRNIPTPFFEVARVLRFSRRLQITRLLLPGALPSIFVGIQIALITAWIGTVGSEYAMGIGRGIGTFVAEGREQFRMDIVILGVVVLALVGYLINLACGRVFRRLLRWQGASP